MITLSNFTFDQSAGHRRFACSVDHPDLPSELFYSVHGSGFETCTEPGANWAAVGLIYPAMLLGEDLNIDHGIDPSLLHMLQTDVQDLLSSSEPHLQKIKVTAPALNSRPLQDRRVGTGFSAGIDTFATLNLYADANTSDALKVTDLAVFNVGAMGNIHVAPPLFERYTARLQKFAKVRGYHWQSIDSNIDAFFGEGYYTFFQKTHTLRNASAALVMEDIYDRYYYSSTYPYGDIGTRNDDMAFIEPLLLPLISTLKMEFVSSGAGMSRLEKTLAVAEYPPAYDILDICVGDREIRARSGKPNCSKCWKCSRALLVFDALGVLDSFSGAFELEEYRRNKKAALSRVMQNAIQGKPADRDTLAFLEDKGLDIPRPNFLVAFVKAHARKSPRIRKIYNAIRR